MRALLFTFVVFGLAVCSLVQNTFAQVEAAADTSVAKATKALIGNWHVKFDPSSVRSKAESRVREKTRTKQLSDEEIQREIAKETSKVEKNAKRQSEGWILCLHADGTGSDIERSADGKGRRPAREKKKAHWKVSTEEGQLVLFLEGAPEPKSILKLVGEDEFILTYPSEKMTFARVKQLPEWATVMPTPSN